MASAMSLNGLDDKIMADERRKYQVESLLAAANTPANPASSLSGSGETSALKIGDAVKFNYLKHQFEGRIVAMAPPKCTVAFKYKNGDDDEQNIPRSSLLTSSFISLSFTLSFYLMSLLFP